MQKRSSFFLPKPKPHQSKAYQDRKTRNLTSRANHSRARNLQAKAQVAPLRTKAISRASCAARDSNTLLAGMMLPAASLSYSCGSKMGVSQRQGPAPATRGLNLSCSRLLGKAEHAQVRLLRAQKTLPRNKLCKPVQASTVELERDVEKENSRQYRRTVTAGLWRAALELLQI